MSTTIQITAGAAEYVGGTIIEINSKDISGDTFDIGLSTTGNAPTVWKAPDVSTVGSAPIVVNGVSVPPNSQRILLLLVSSTLPTGSPMVAGQTYSVWARVHDVPEIPARLLQKNVIAV